MTAPGAGLTVQQAGRRYLLLTALRWLPVGLSLPVTVLLALSRGLSLAQVGLLFLVHSLVVSVLELPTGGLADVVGRRPVLVASGLLHLASCLAYAAAGSFAGFLVGTVLLAVGRALDSGPLEAWYVDAALLADPAVDLAPGLARAGVADCLALAAGALVGGLTPSVLGGDAGLLAAPYVASAVLDLVSVAAVLRLVTPTGPPPGGAVLATVRTGLSAVPRTVSSSVSLSVHDSALRRVLVLSLICGYCLSTLELMGPERFAALAGGTTGGSGLFGAVMAVSFLAAAVGALLGPRVRRVTGGSTRWAVAGLTVAAGLALAGVATAGTVVLAGASYAAFYAVNAAAWPLLRTLAHARVGAAQRATVLSGWSMALQGGGALSNVISPHLGRAAFGVAGALAVAGGLLALRLPRDPVVEQGHGRVSGCPTVAGHCGAATGGDTQLGDQRVGDVDAGGHLT